MVAEKEDREDESLGMRLPGAASPSGWCCARRAEATSAALMALADNRTSPRCWRACRTPMARRRRALSSRWPPNPARPALVLALTPRPGDAARFIGCAGLNATDRGLDLGYWIGEPYWKHGYATEAAHALVDLAFRATTISALHASCRVINPASRRVIHKCGFQYAGQGMMNSIVAGQVPVERYRLDRKTWVSLRTWRNS